MAAAGHPGPLPRTRACFIHAHESLVSSKYHADLEMEEGLMQLGGFCTTRTFSKRAHLLVKPVKRINSGVLRLERFIYTISVPL